MPPVCYFCGSGYKEQGNTNVCSKCFPRILDLEKMLTAHIKIGNDLRAQMNPCEVHGGSRRACGQCFSSVEAEKISLQKRVKFIEEQVTLVCDALERSFHTLSNRRLDDFYVNEILKLNFIRLRAAVDPMLQTPTEGQDLTTAMGFILKNK